MLGLSRVFFVFAVFFPLLHFNYIAWCAIYLEDTLTPHLFRQPPQAAGGTGGGAFKNLYTTMNPIAIGCGASLIHQKYGAIGVSYFGSLALDVGI